MNRSFVKNVIAVIVGVCVLTMIFGAVSFVADAALSDDFVALKSDAEIMRLIKWTALSLAFIFVPALVCYVFTCFTKNRAMNICAAAISFFIVCTCIAFFIVAHNLGMKDNSAEDFAAVSGYLSDLLQFAVPALIICVFYILRSVGAFDRKSKDTVVTEAEHE